MSQTVLLSLSLDELRSIVRDAVRAEIESHASERDVMTAKQVAEMLNTHPVVVRRYVRTRDLPANKIGTSYRFKRADVLEWLEKQKG